MPVRRLPNVGQGQALRRVEDRRLLTGAGRSTCDVSFVHEAYAAIVGGQSLEIKDRAHFMALASRAMRRVLVDHARARASQKRDHQKVALHGIEPGEPSKIVELRYFGGMSVEETAAALQISARSVKRKWSVARLWLYDRLAGTSP